MNVAGYRVDLACPRRFHPEPKLRLPKQRVQARLWSGAVHPLRGDTGQTPGIDRLAHLLAACDGCRWRRTIDNQQSATQAASWPRQAHQRVPQARTTQRGNFP
ncbi:hypothetical protein OK348_05975 [Flavobacterium sp. MXW15]|uniref:Transposase n=1 Tax=Xanthomonas chitinilytica TaxID=2989819 RepID=A0ABT3JSU3_9XANT|nr:hypothetical protein [Xanthomonas sp. H13-6]MCW4454339.1 hypothetical protein [Flavobacterium sp. MXW15]MCW4471571.1 hypothetical protein [Xanthomonas sp. H13-6]